MANISLRDVALAAGVSISTVSKVVSGTAVRSRIHPATITKVLDLVDELGYVPNHTARRLRAQGTGQLGLVLSGPYDPCLTMMYWLDGALFYGLSVAAREHHLPAVILYPQVGDELIQNTARYVDGRIDGLLVRCLYHSEHRLLDVIDPGRLPRRTVEPERPAGNWLRRR
jgi:LacI family transcriptional regulator